MRIQDYSFGKIYINNKIYDKDLILVNDVVYENWRRKKGHELSLDDLFQVLDNQVKVMFIGTGKFGMMKVSDSVVEILKTKGFSSVIVEKSNRAIELFNNCQEENKILAIHLTC